MPDTPDTTTPDLSDEEAAHAADLRAEAVKFVAEHPDAIDQIADLEAKYGEYFWEEAADAEVPETPVDKPSTPSSRGDDPSPAQKAREKAAAKKDTKSK